MPPFGPPKKQGGAKNVAFKPKAPRSKLFNPRAEEVPESSGRTEEYPVQDGSPQHYFPKSYAEQLFGPAVSTQRDDSSSPFSRSGRTYRTAKGGPRWDLSSEKSGIEFLQPDAHRPESITEMIIKIRPRFSRQKTLKRDGSLRSPGGTINRNQRRVAGGGAAAPISRFKPADEAGPSIPNWPAETNTPAETFGGTGTTGGEEVVVSVLRHHTDERGDVSSREVAAGLAVKVEGSGEGLEGGGPGSDGPLSPSKVVMNKQQIHAMLKELSNSGTIERQRTMLRRGGSMKPASASPRKETAAGVPASPRAGAATLDAAGIQDVLSITKRRPAKEAPSSLVNGSADAGKPQGRGHGQATLERKMASLQRQLHAIAKAAAPKQAKRQGGRSARSSPRLSLEMEGHTTPAAQRTPPQSTPQQQQDARRECESVSPSWDEMAMLQAAADENPDSLPAFDFGVGMGNADYATARLGAGPRQPRSAAQAAASPRAARRDPQPQAPLSSRKPAAAAAAAGPAGRGPPRKRVSDLQMGHMQAALVDLEAQMAQLEKAPPKMWSRPQSVQASCPASELARAELPDRMSPSPGPEGPQTASSASPGTAPERAKTPPLASKPGFQALKERVNLRRPRRTGEPPSPEPSSSALP